MYYFIGSSAFQRPIQHAVADEGVQRMVKRISGCALGVSSGNINVIREVVDLNIRPGDSAAFERAFAEAQAISAARARYVSRKGEAFAM